MVTFRLHLAYPEMINGCSFDRLLPPLLSLIVGLTG
jgi:hypothetical protein